MMKLKWIFWGVTLGFALAFSLAVVFSPPVGRYPSYFAVVKVVLAPVFLVLEFVGKHHLWPFSEKAHWPVAIVTGFLLTLTSMAYAAIFTSVIAIARKIKHNAQPGQAG